MKNNLINIYSTLQYFPFAQSNHKIFDSSNASSNCKRIYHYHIRKTGGTSLNFMFFSALTGKDSQTVYKELNQSRNHFSVSNGKILVGWNKYLLEKGDYHYGFSHIPAHELALPKDTFTLTIIRDPIKRLISHYKMLLHYRENSIKHSCMRKESSWLGKSLDDFLMRTPEEHLQRQLYMFSKEFNVEEAFEKISRCSFFCLTEELDSGLEELTQKTGIKLESYHEKKSTNSVLLDPSMEAKIRDLLGKEITLYEKLKEFKKQSVNRKYEY